MRRLLEHIDKANGFVYASLAGRSPYPPEMVYGAAAQRLADSDIYLSLQVLFAFRSVRRFRAVFCCSTAF